MLDLDLQYTPREVLKLTFSQLVALSFSNTIQPSLNQPPDYPQLVEFLIRNDTIEHLEWTYAPNFSPSKPFLPRLRTACTSIFSIPILATSMEVKRPLTSICGLTINEQLLALLMREKS